MCAPRDPSLPEKQCGTERAAVAALSPQEISSGAIMQTLLRLCRDSLNNAGFSGMYINLVFIFKE